MWKHWTSGRPSWLRHPSSQVTSREAGLEGKPAVYEYEAIDASHEIRLFTFVDSHSSDDIAVSIERAAVNDLPKYICLSYAWGSATDTREIRCNGQRLKITSSLWLFLRRIRPRIGRNRFWADQICINQAADPASLQERSAQVKLMSTIFPGALAVVCWLGEADEYTSTAFNALRTWERAEKDLALRATLRRDWVCDNTAKSQAQWFRERALQELFRREWFKRAWTLQEVFVSDEKPPFVLCGDLDINWNIVCAAYRTFCFTLDVADISNILGLDLRFPQLMITLYLSRGLGQIRLSDLFFKAVERSAKDPRDCIFALLGIMQYEGFDYTPPEYNLTEEQVFIAYTREMMARDGDLTALTLVMPPDYNDGLPSWVLSPNRIRTFSNGCSFTTERERRDARKIGPFLDPITDSFDGTLTLYGLPIGRVTKTFGFDQLKMSIANPGKRWEEVVREMAVFARSLGLSENYESTGESRTAALMKTLVANDFFVACTVPGRMYGREQDLLLYRYLGRSPAAGSRIGSLAARALRKAGHEVWTARSLYQLALDHFHFEEAASTETDSSSIDPDKRATLEWLSTALVQDLGRKVKEGKGGAILACMTDGSLALVPRYTQPGDTVCHLVGGTLPLVLRYSGVDAEYRSLGEAYVHGYMGGIGAQRCEEWCSLDGSDGNARSRLTKFCLV